MKFFISGQFGPNLCLSYRKFYEDYENNILSFVRPILFELWQKIILDPPLTLFTYTPLVGFRILKFDFCRLGMIDKVFLNIHGDYQVPEVRSIEDNRGGQLPPPTAISQSQLPTVFRVKTGNLIRYALSAPIFSKNSMQ